MNPHPCPPGASCAVPSRDRWLCAVAATMCLTLTAAAVAQNAPGKLLVQRSSGTGQVSFVTAADGGIIPVTKRVGRGTINAMDFMYEYGHVFGVTNPASQLREQARQVDELGETHTSYEQLYDGVRVFGGVLRVHQNAGGDIVAANGDFFDVPDKIQTAPTIGEADAVAIARRAIGNDVAEAIKKELVVVDPGWYGDPAIGPRLAYHVELVRPEAFEHEAFFIDAHSGMVLDRWSRICALRNRRIHDANYSDDIPGALVRAEGDAAVASPVDANRAYDYYGDVYDYYFRAFGRDSINAAGMPIVGTVRWRDDDVCPNAFWVGSEKQMIFCEGAITDDIVAHELTHGVTENTANLIYQNQSGQMNESFSDIFGELVDLFNGNAGWPGAPTGPAWPDHPTGSGQDTPNNLRTDASQPPFYTNGVRWLMGEDADVFGGAIRDLWDPESYGDPATANSELQLCRVGDSGGVHSGSGVLSHAFAIATDGKTFNDITVAGVGPIKSGAVWYRALTTYLTPTADFQDAYAALNRSAADLVGTIPNDPRTGLPSASAFTAADAAEIDKALRAVELDTPGRCGVQPLMDPVTPPTCSGQRTIYEDRFDGDTTDWATASSGSSGVSWLRVNNLPDGRTGTAWFFANPNVECNRNHSGLGKLTSPEITLPDDAQGAMLRFTHAVQTEDYFDGGNLKLQVNNGSWKLIPPAAFRHNPYNRIALYPEQYTRNPLGGEPAFSGWGGYWYTSIIDLTGLATAGDRLRVRFESGLDECVGRVGWYVDDFQVFDCPGGGDCNANGIDDQVETTEGPRPAKIVEYLPTYGGYVYLGAFDWPSFAHVFPQTQDREINSISIWGGFFGSLPDQDVFTIRFVDYNNFQLGDAVFEEINAATEYEFQSIIHGGVYIYKLTFNLAAPLELPRGQYLLEIYKDISDRSTFYWEVSEYVGDEGVYVALEAPGQDWYYYGAFRLAYAINGTTIGEDCNANFVPDECESQADCNFNGVRDICDIAAGTSADCNADGVPNECEGDCNSNSIPDGCDIAAGTSSDCNANVTPDECEPYHDCNTNGIQDLCEADCNTNAFADECDIATGVSTDCNQNGQPDECETFADCNQNQINDLCELFDGTVDDCDQNNVPDDCQMDADRDGTIDPCDACPQDSAKIAAGICGCGVADTDADADGTADCHDGCPNDSKKIAPGDCGCGKSDADSDDDGVADCNDVCTNGDDSIDTDKDGTPDCADECPDNPELVKAGQCGCGEPEYDPDGDTVASCIDNCPMNANPDQVDADSDGLGDMCDGCPNDPDKTAIGLCGCGVPDIDTDDDGLYDCADNCPNDPTPNRSDRDRDGVGDACDACPDDPNKTEPGVCGCGRVERDDDRDGVFDCLDGCLNTPAGIEVDANGCAIPDVPAVQPTPEPDADGDGVADSADDCPDTAADVAVDSNGCPVTEAPDDGKNPDDPNACGAGAPCGALGVASVLAVLAGLGGLGMRRRRY